MVERPYNADLRRLFQKGRTILAPKGELIIGNSRQPDGVYYISSGYIKTYSIGNDGGEYIHLIYGPGEIFPLVWAYLGHEMGAVYYETISETELLRITKADFEDCITTTIDVAHGMSVQLAKQFQIYSERVNNLEYRKASARVAYRLLFLAKRFGVRQGSCIVIEAPITHELFANSVNLARESVSRELEKLEHLGIIERVHHKIQINDSQQLSDRLDLT